MLFSPFVVNLTDLIVDKFCKGYDWTVLDASLLWILHFWSYFLNNTFTMDNDQIYCNYSI